jgi:chorismate-pyruvate lyase
MNRQSLPLTPDLETLTALFYPNPELLGQFSEVAGPNMPPRYRKLLDHNDHMTVTVEAFHASRVDVQVLDKVITPTHYARKILLARQSDGEIVQFGIMRVNLAYLEPAARDEIVSEKTPLGRVLIKHNVLRRVRLSRLWQVIPGQDLVRMFRLAAPHETYGRTALIECNDEPAIELIEIVAPLLQ